MRNERDFSIAKESLRDKLNAIILLEVSKDYKEMNSELVSDCVDVLMELEGKKRLTKEEIRQRVNAIPFEGKTASLSNKQKKNIKSKKIILVAAVIMVILSLFAILGFASNDWICNFLNSSGIVFNKRLDDGPVEYENVTFFKTDETVHYSSVEELVKTEGVTVLYPGWMPDYEKIVDITYTRIGDIEKYSYLCENPYYGISVEIGNGAEVLEKILAAGVPATEISGYSLYCTQNDSYITAYFIYNDDSYSIVTATEDDLFRIMENLKEIS